MNEENYAPFNFPVEDKSERIIKVIGVGGGGGNAVQHMWEEGVRNVTFIVTNTDSQVLSANKVPNKLLLGPGLGAGGIKEEGKRIAEENIDEIHKMFDDETKMVFITAGLGGGTGTGAMPVIARVAKEMGIRNYPIDAPVGLKIDPDHLNVFAKESGKLIKTAVLEQ